MSMKTRIRRFALTLGLAPAGAVVAGSHATAQSFDELSEGVRGFVSVEGPAVALTGVTVIDGTGSGVVRDQTVVIENDRIIAVGPAGSVDVPPGAEVRDLAGHTVIPGMVGLHNHMFFSGAGGRGAQGSFTSPRLYLAAGVTTIRTTGSRAPYSDINVRADIEAGRCAQTSDALGRDTVLAERLLQRRGLLAAADEGDIGSVTFKRRRQCNAVALSLRGHHDRLEPTRGRL